VQPLIACLIFCAVAASAIYWAVTKRIGLGLTTILLCFSIVSGFMVANYDLVRKLRWGAIEVETAKREITEAKESAIKEIATEVKEQKESIKLLISNANDTREKMEKQKDALNDVIRKASDLQSKIEEQKKRIVELNQSAEKTKKEIEKLNLAASQIALILVRATYFTIETKSEFGTDRATKAIQEVLNDLNKILPMVIPDEKERADWVKRLQTTLPPRK
jgi:ABC-type transporter Mla subunit MlaD